MPLPAARRVELECCQLEYLLRYITADDPSAGLLRTFTDNWFAFYSGGELLNRNGRPHWFNNPNPAQHREAFAQMHFISTEAEYIINGRSAGALVKDHAVPLRDLRVELMRQKPKQAEHIRSILIEHYRVGIISKRQHGQLALRDKSRRARKDYDGLDWLGRYAESGVAFANGS